jgi:hypothetical protein
LKKYVLRARNSGVVAYSGSSANDVKGQMTTPAGTIISNGKLGTVAPNTEGIANIDASGQGVVLFPSGNFTVKTDLVGSAASSKPENNTAQLSLGFKCKALNGTTWQ